MVYFYLDASALAKCYVKEKGTAVMNYFMDHVPYNRMMALLIGLSETVSIFVRKKNSNVISQLIYRQTLVDFKKEIVDNLDFMKISVKDHLVYDSIIFVEKYSINATDAIILQSCVEIAKFERQNGHDLVLLTSDKRLQKAAEAEQIHTLNPELDDINILDDFLTPTNNEED